MLEKKWNSPVGKVTMHAPHENGDQLESYTTWISADLINNSGVVRGITVAMSLKSVPILNKDYVWFCDNFKYA